MPARRWTARRLVSPRSRLNSYPSSFVTVAGLRAVFGEYGMPLAIDVWASVIGGTGHRDMLFDYLEGELGRQGGRARADAGAPARRGGYASGPRGSRRVHRAGERGGACARRRTSPDEGRSGRRNKRSPVLAVGWWSAATFWLNRFRRFVTSVAPSSLYRDLPPQIRSSVRSGPHDKDRTGRRGRSGTPVCRPALPTRLRPNRLPTSTSVFRCYCV